jgi:hypothetical protein
MFIMGTGSTSAAAPRSREVDVERFAGGRRGRMGKRHGHPQQRVRPDSAFCGGAVQRDHFLVQRALIDIDPGERLGNFPVDIRHRFQYALAAVTALVAVPQLQRFTHARGRAGWHCRAAKGAPFEPHFHFDGRVAARIQNFPAAYL